MTQGIFLPTDRILDQPFTCLALLDDAGRVLEVNDAALARSGSPREDIVGRAFCDAPWWTGIPEARASLIDAIMRAARGERSRYDSIIALGPGPLPVDVQVSPFEVASAPARPILAIVTQIATSGDLTDGPARDDRDSRHAEQRLQSVFDSMLTSVLVADGTGRLLFANAFAGQMFGYSRAELLRMHAQDLHPPAELATIMPRFQQAFRGEVVIHDAIPIRRADGSERLAEIRVSPIEFEGHRAVLGLFADVTERAQMAKALRESEARYRLAINAAHAAMWDVDLSTGRQVVNDTWFTLLGYAPGTVEPTYARWYGHVHPDDLAKIDHVSESVAKGQIEGFDHEHRVITCSGATRWHHSVGRVIDRDTEGKPLRMIGTVVDITERVHAQERIREALHLVQLATEAAELGIWSLDMATDRSEWDDRLCAWYEVPKEICQHGWLHQVWLERLHPEDRARAVALFDAAVRHKAPYHDVYRLLLPSGRVRYIQTSGVIEPDPEGHLHRMVGINRDITEQREQEDALRAAKSAAEAASIAKSAFVANMSHEVRTPMNAVLGFLDILLDTRLDSDQRTLVEKIKGAGEALLRILNDILDFSKLDAAAVQLEVAPFRLDAVLQQAMDLFAAAAHQKGLDLSIDLQPEAAGHYLGDALRLSQILNNLVGNAVKFSQHGHVELSVRALDAEGARRRLRFEVRDEGIGLSPEEAAHLFQPFTQADVSITRRFGGTGLGLTISKGLVELMGGHIGVDRRPSGGSIFWFTLPLGVAETTPSPRPGHARQPAAAWTEASSDAPSLSRLRGAQVLLVEDNLTNQEIAVAMLRKLGLQVTVANQGREALELLERGSFDLVLMDLQMPVMDGFETTAVIRSSDWGRSLPIIAMTAAAFPEDRQRVLNAGMNDYVSKPVEPRRLVSALQRWLPERGPPAIEGTETTAPADQGPGGTGQTDQPPRAEPALLMPLAGFDLMATLQRLDGDAALLRLILRAFQEEFTDWSDAFDTARASGDARGALRMTHTLKGAAANVGAIRVQASAAALERALTEGSDTGAVTALARDCRTALAEARATLRSLLTTEQVDRGEPRLDAARADLDELAELLRGHRLVKAPVLERLRQHLGQHPVATELERLIAAIHAFDFNHASIILNEMQARLR
jgi:PAS domain S-box-containing protein